MGIIFKEYLDAEYVYECAECGAHLASPPWILSKGFNGALGKAYLFSSVVNVYEGDRESRDLLTGKHIVSDVFCVSCNMLLGWKYIDTRIEDQKYKIGHVILEKSLIRLTLQTFSGASGADRAKPRGGLVGGASVSRSIDL